jgi:hypothetical protein
VIGEPLERIGKRDLRWLHERLLAADQKPHNSVRSYCRRAADACPPGMGLQQTKSHIELLAHPRLSWVRTSCESALQLQDYLMRPINQCQNKLSLLGSSKDTNLSVLFECSENEQISHWQKLNKFWIALQPVRASIAVLVEL